MIHSILLQILKFLAKTIIFVHKPFIIGVTGTVGKSTITSHVGKFLSIVYGSKNVLYSHDHYNGEFGLPLTIIHEKTGGKNVFRWFYIIGKGIMRIFLPFPKYLVLEYGIDHPGEMDFLLSIATPDIAILTEIAPNHLEQFGTLERYRNEKLKILHTPKYTIVHGSHKQYVDREALFYGIGAMSDVDISHVKVDISGTHAQIHIAKMTYDIVLPTFGVFHIENILPLYTLSQILAIDFGEVSKYLKTYTPESGRSGLLKGVNGSIIIDGSYNGGYLSIKEGITSLLTLLPTHRVIFFLGDMRELGGETEKMHTLLALDINTIIPYDADVIFYCVGPYMKQYFLPHLRKSFDTYHGLSSIQAGKEISKIIKSDKDISTIVFVKGSQNTIFLEEGIKEFIASSSDVKMLCRQSDEWLKKKSIFFNKKQ